MYVYLYVCIDFLKIILMLLSFMRSSRAEDSMNLTASAGTCRGAGSITRAGQYFGLGLAREIGCAP